MNYRTLSYTDAKRIPDICHASV